MLIPKLKKSISFNGRYEGTKAFDASLLIVKSCGSNEFYEYLCDKISENIHEKPQPVLTDMLHNIKQLVPTPIDVDRQMLRSAARSLLDVLAYIQENPYVQDMDYENRTYEDQVVFCMNEAFIFFLRIQQIEQFVFQAESQSEMIVAKYHKEQELLANTNQIHSFKKR